MTALRRANKKIMQKTHKEYIVFCDESDKKGEYFSNFYGGLIISFEEYKRLKPIFEAEKLRLNLYKEIKWSKVSENYLEKYKKMIDLFFKEIKSGNIKVRIFFKSRADVFINISKENKDKEYFLLYYQFIKHAFGFRYAPVNDHKTHVRLYFDEFPETKEKIDEFKKFIHRLNYQPELQYSNFAIRFSDITEVKSDQHVFLQCLDIVLGSMSFRLNNKNKALLPNKKRRGRKTIAKENLYKHILNRICEIRPNFNIGDTTGKDSDISNYWHHVYRHWKFVPKKSIRDESLTKGAQKNSTDGSTTPT